MNFHRLFLFYSYQNYYFQPIFSWCIIILKLIFVGTLLFILRNFLLCETKNNWQKLVMDPSSTEICGNLSLALIYAFFGTTTSLKITPEKQNKNRFILQQTQKLHDFIAWFLFTLPANEQRGFSALSLFTLQAKKHILVYKRFTQW